MRSPEVRSRRRLQPVVVLPVLVVALAIIWTGLWLRLGGGGDHGGLAARELGRPH
jgi:hypothetical protein